MNTLTCSDRVDRYVVEKGTPITLVLHKTGECYSGLAGRKYVFIVHPKVETRGRTTRYIFDDSVASLVVESRHVEEIRLTRNMVRVAPPWTGFSGNRRRAI